MRAAAELHLQPGLLIGTLNMPFGTFWVCFSPDDKSRSVLLGKAVRVIDEQKRSTCG